MRRQWARPGGRGHRLVAMDVELPVDNDGFEERLSQLRDLHPRRLVDNNEERPTSSTSTLLQGDKSLMLKQVYWILISTSGKLKVIW